jgi:hypothetical protein
MKLQRCKRIARQLLTFAAVVIGVPNNAARVVAFDEYHAGAGAQVARHRGQSHGVGLRNFGLDGFF